MYSTRAIDFKIPKKDKNLAGSSTDRKPNTTESTDCKSGGLQEKGNFQSIYTADETDSKAQRKGTDCASLDDVTKTPGISLKNKQTPGPKLCGRTSIP